MELFKHQEEALAKTAQFNKVGYFLDMGLGKTFVGSEKMRELGAGVNLVVCQKSKVDDWIDHFKNNYVNIQVVDLTSKKESISAFVQAFPACTLVGIINYELIFRRKELLSLTGFTLMLDESQFIQNENAKRSAYILRLQKNAKNVILLSGTPTSGKYERLWSQCRLLGWDISKTAYWKTYIDTEWIKDSDTGFKREHVIGYKNVERLKRKLREHGAVFMKTEECFDLPKQSCIYKYLPVSKEYRRFSKDSVVDVEGVELVGDCILTKMLYLRQLCGQYSIEKLQAFKDLVESTDGRVIVFYNFYAELGKLVEITQELEKPYSIVNGKIKDLAAYENEGNAITFVQYQAGATGLNLQKAYITIYYTLPFGKGSCATYEQSKKRTHRIGQDEACIYYHLLCKGSIEEWNLKALEEGVEYNEELFKTQLELGS